MVKRDSQSKSKDSRQHRIIFFGTPQFGADILQGLIAKGLILVAVVTRADKPIGKTNQPQPSKVAKTASKYNLPILKPTKLKDPQFIDQLKSLNPTLSIVASYGKIIPKEVLDIPLYGNINVHGSLLPKYRGASPIQSAIVEGQQQTGVTIMLMDEEMDHGDILAQASTPIDENDTFITLSAKMAAVGSEIIAITITKYINWKIKTSVAISPNSAEESSFQFFIPPKTQDHSQATYTKMLSRQDGFIDLTSPPDTEKLKRMIRAFHPWPGVWSKLPAPSNKIIKFLPGNKVQIEGKNPILWKAFVNGHPQFAHLWQDSPKT